MGHGPTDNNLGQASGRWNGHPNNPPGSSEPVYRTGIPGPANSSSDYVINTANVDILITDFVEFVSPLYYPAAPRVQVEGDGFDLKHSSRA